MSKIITKESDAAISFLRMIDQIQSRLDTLIEGYKPILNGDIYLTDKEVSERLKVSRRTLLEWRSSGKIEYIQLEGKIIYAESAIQRLLDSNRQKAWSE